MQCTLVCVPYRLSSIVRSGTDSSMCSLMCWLLRPVQFDVLRPLLSAHTRSSYAYRPATVEVH